MPSLHKGFWLYTDTKFRDANSNYPTTLDMSSKGSILNEHIKFIRTQVEVEVTTSRYSTPLGPKLLLGMYSSPVHAYLNFWVHPIWQIKQIVLVVTKQYVDHCNCFGGYISHLIFLSFSLLLAWITG